MEGRGGRVILIFLFFTQEQPADAQAQRVRGTGSAVAAQLERDILGAAVPGREPGHEDVHDGAVHVPVQLDAAVRARVHCPAAGRGGVHVRAVRRHAQPARVRVPQRRVPQGDAARRVRRQTDDAVAGMRRRPLGRRRAVPARPADRGPSAGQRVRAQFPHVVRRVPTLVRLAHAAARRRRLCRHLQPGKRAIGLGSHRVRARIRRPMSSGWCSANTAGYDVRGPIQNQQTGGRDYREFLEPTTSTARVREADDNSNRENSMSKPVLKNDQSI